MGCDPYCLCDTVVQMQCQNGSLISGKCSDSESLTENSASYTFNEACAGTVSFFDLRNFYKTLFLVQPSQDFKECHSQ